MNTIHWRNLVISDQGVSGNPSSTLGMILGNPHVSLEDIDLSSEDGIGEWEGYYMLINGEVCNWDTTKVSIDWTGFFDALDNALDKVAEDAGIHMYFAVSTFGGNAEYMSYNSLSERDRDMVCNSHITPIEFSEIPEDALIQGVEFSDGFFTRGGERFDILIGQRIIEELRK